MQPDPADMLQESLIGASSRTLSEFPLINIFSIPGRRPGLELANAFGINTGNSRMLVSQVCHCQTEREGSISEAALPLFGLICGSFCRNGTCHPN
jgi:hypothetical protein